MNTTLADKWESYRAAVVADIGDEQIDSERMAFYAGALSMITAMHEGLATAETHEECREVVTRLCAEVDAFASLVINEIDAENSGPRD